jgi:DNA transposition AAA+ family ATPase
MNSPSDEQKDSDETALSSEEFIATKEYRRFAEFCDACRRYCYIGLCYGPPGVGKTLSARQYAQWDLIEPLLPRYMARDMAVPPSVRACRTVLYTPEVENRPANIARAVDFFRHQLSEVVKEADGPHEGTDNLAWPPPVDYTELIIVDEADRLKMAGIEQMRDIYDRGKIGLILIGMPGIEKRLARYPQLYSRVGFVHQFRPLSQDELRFILEQKWEQFGLSLRQDDFTDTEAVAAIIRITGGNFRLVQRLLTQIERILQINEMHTVTKEVVEAARENLVIGIV